jgi:predicted FMN-binding regulatory protein PaiB
VYIPAPFRVEDPARLYEIIETCSFTTLVTAADEVVGFEIPVERIEGKFKLGQNKPVEDQARVVQALGSAEDATSRALAAQGARVIRRG